VETFKYIRVVFTSDGRRIVEIDTWVGNAVLRELYIAPWLRKKSFQRTQSFVFKSVFVPILACGHESWVTTERILSKEYFRRVLGVTLRDKNTGLKSVKPGKSNHFSESRDRSYIS